MGDITLDKTLVRPVHPSECIYSDNTEAGDTITAGQIVYLNSTSGWTLAAAGAAGTISGQIGLVVAPQDSVDGDTGLSVLLKGLVCGFTGMTPGALHFVSDTAGAIATSHGTITKHVGYADSATVLHFDPNAPANPT